MSNLPVRRHKRRTSLLLIHSTLRKRYSRNLATTGENSYHSKLDGRVNAPVELHG